MDWIPDDVPTALRAFLGSSPPDMWALDEVTIQGDQLFLIFRVHSSAPVRPPHDPATRYGVHYSIADAPDGPNTGTRCETAQDWAQEIKWDIDEQVETGGIGRADREPGPDGVVLLRWRC